MKRFFPGSVVCEEERSPLVQVVLRLTRSEVRWVGLTPRP